MQNVNREISIYESIGPEASSPHLAGQLAGQFTSGDRGMIQEEITAKLEHAISAMDATDHEVIAMRHFEELTPDEIAILLGITSSGVLKRYGRSIRRLSTVLETNSTIRRERYDSE